MNQYNQTKNDYNKGAEWHFKKTLSYDWSKQIEKFILFLKGKKVLDAGCGAPRDIPLFLQQNIDVEGIDFSEAAIKKCRDTFPHLTFYLGDFRKINVPDEYYDGIWACASLLNIPQKEMPTVLQEFSRVLKSGGIIFISLKEGEGEKMVPDKYGERFFSFYSEELLKNIFENAGFKILLSETFSDEFFTGVASKKPGWVYMYAKKK